MKYLSEFRNPDAVKQLLESIQKETQQPWQIMEICGGQTHAIMKYGLQELLPESVLLLHGPGCPVCVTPLAKIEAALQLAEQKQVIFCSFGDMLRVPGKNSDLLKIRARGANVRIVYSPMDALAIAQSNPNKEVVFFAIGFETTAPATAMAVWQARKQDIENFSMLVAHVLVPPAIEAILCAPECRIQGFLAPGHVCTVTGYQAYEPLSKKYKVPIVMTGFEPVDLLRGTRQCVRMMEQKEFTVNNQYGRSVKREGNINAIHMIETVFQPVDREWRGIGPIPQSGLALKDDYKPYDAELKFGLDITDTEEDKRCIAGQVLRGSKKPIECAAFGYPCTPETPLGAPMVSSEGACSAYYRYRLKNS